MLHERILILVKYVTNVIAGTQSWHFFFFLNPFFVSGQSRPDHTILRSLSALLASLPASENKHFREEFNTVHT